MLEATVRYGYMMYIGSFPSNVPLRGGDRVIVKTDRGTELGEVITVCEQVASSEELEARQEEQAPVEPSTKDAHSDTAQSRTRRGPQGSPHAQRVIRKATREDLARAREVSETTEPAEFKFCQQKIQELSVPMRMAAVEHLFGGEKVIFYFLAESRVDFRALVRELAREYRTRIEMKQIGARDEAKLLSDYEHCGRELCCRRFIRSLEPVTIRMAKSQKATLDPAKISGACGRLMCCLRFEHPIYQELKKELPRKGQKVKTPKGEGEVIKYNIIAQTVLVEESTGEKVTYKAKELSWGAEPNQPHGDEEDEESQHTGESPREGETGA